MARRKSVDAIPPPPVVVSPTKNDKGKGKAIQILPEIIPIEDADELCRLTNEITAQASSLAPGNHDLALAERAKEVVRSSFNRALQSETLSFPHLAALLKSLNPAAGPATRSSTAAPAPVTAALALSLTPLQELTTEGMDDEMIWEQMEMRGKVVVELLEEMFGAGGNGRRGEEDDSGGENDDDDEGDEGMLEDEESGSDEEGSEEEGEFGENDDEYEDEEESSDSDEGETEPFTESEPYFKSLTGSTTNDDDPEADSNRGLTLDNFDQLSSGGRRRKAQGPPSVVDDTFFSLHDFHVQIDEGEAEMAKALRQEFDDEDEEGDPEDDIDLFAAVGGLNGGDDDDEEEDLDGANIMYADFFEPPPRPIVASKSKEGKKRNKAPPMGETRPEEELERAPVVANSNGKRSVRFSEAVKVKAIPARGSEFDKLVNKVGWAKAMEITDAQEEGFVMQNGEDADGMDQEDATPFGAEEEDDEEEADQMTFEDEDEMMRNLNGENGEEEDDGEDGSEFESEDEEGRETIDRLKSSLFDEENSEDENATPAAQLSRHERRLLALSSQIASLEAENVGAKNWATKGEAKSRDRPFNSLLEEDLEYERSGKVVPIITEETTKTIEDLIKKRIIDNQFDDVVRQRAIDPNAFLPSRFMELQDSRSNKSLAEIYEEDYTTAKERDAGRKVVHELDKDLAKKHDEIEELFEELSGKLDALSNARFTPKPPKTSITTISNVASITLESALPTATSTAALLAPEEVFTIDPTNEDRSDFTPSMKKQARQKRRKARASMAKSMEQFSQGAKGEKERATKELIGTKGVTVIGKGGKIETGAGKKRKRDDDTASGRSGVAFKL